MPDFAHQAMSTALTLASGDFFDKEYMQHAGVGDHRRTVDLLRDLQYEAKDAVLKGYAKKSVASGPAPSHHSVYFESDTVSRTFIASWQDIKGSFGALHHSVTDLR